MNIEDFIVPAGYMLVKTTTGESLKRAMKKYYEKNKEKLIEKRIDIFKNKYANDPEYNKQQRDSSRIRSATTRAFNKRKKELQEANEEYKEEEVLEQVKAMILEKEKTRPEKPLAKRVRRHPEGKKTNNMCIEKIQKKVLVDFS
jgi:hypothetical protein